MTSYPSSICRRDLLRSAGCGFASLALAGMGGYRSASAARSVVSGANPLAAKPPMHPPRAKRIIFLFMAGGPSHVDTFDYKPELIQRDGQEIDFVGVRFQTFGKLSKRRLMKPLWKFQQYGENGTWVSELFPHVAKRVDELCFLHGMHTEGIAHGPSTLFMHTGATNLVRPSMGAWVTYGLGTENDSLPAFITINPSDSEGGPRNYSNAFLPAAYQGTAIGKLGQSLEKDVFRHVSRDGVSAEWQRRQYDYLNRLNRLQATASGADDQLEATIASYELAFRMQSEAPAVTDLSAETKETQAMYGLDRKETEKFGRQCLLARKFAEAGVRYVQVTYRTGASMPDWDQHEDMPVHAKHALATDKPIAGLLEDLKQRGLLEDTLVWIGGEFGRNPFAQGKNGRDHNPRGFTVMLAGGGVKPGFHYGKTDELGHHAVEGKVHMHDLHATILHLLGLDHELLTYPHAGRDFRLTDVHGHIVHEIIA